MSDSTHRPTEETGAQAWKGALWPVLPGKTRFLAWAIATFYDEPFPSVEVLAARTGMAANTVRRLLGDLEQAGWLRPDRDEKSETRHFLVVP